MPTSRMPRPLAEVPLHQNNLKRLLAYSSISHAGYALMGIAAASLLGVLRALESRLSTSIDHFFACGESSVQARPKPVRP